MFDIIRKEIKEGLAFNAYLQENLGEKPLLFGLIRHINTSPNAKIYLVGFNAEDAKPVCFGKIARFNSGRPFLIKTHENLMWLKGHRNLADLKNSFPFPILCKDIQNKCVQIESYLEGLSCSDAIAKYGLARWLDLANSWLFDFHQKTAEDIILTEELTGSLFLIPLESVGRLAGSDPEIFMFLERIKARWRERAGSKMTLVCSHNNLSFKNIKINEGAISVFDWENAQVSGPPLLDLLHLFFSYYNFLNNNNFKLSLRNIFSGRIDKKLTVYFKAYSEKFGLTKDCLQLLLMQFLFSKLLNVQSYRPDLLGVLSGLAKADISWKNSLSYA